MQGLEYNKLVLVVTVLVTAIFVVRTSAQDSICPTGITDLLIESSMFCAMFDVVVVVVWVWWMLVCDCSVVMG